ncbi:MAG: Rid family hydrolase [Sphingomonadales bacterium]
MVRAVWPASFEWGMKRWPSAMRSSCQPAASCEINRYSAAIHSGNFLLDSGQVCSRDDEWPEPVFEKQVQLAFDSLAAVMKAASCTFDDVTLPRRLAHAVRDGCRPSTEGGQAARCKNGAAGSLPQDGCGRATQSGQFLASEPI